MTQIAIACFSNPRTLVPILFPHITSWTHIVLSLKPPSNLYVFTFTSVLIPPSFSVPSLARDHRLALLIPFSLPSFPLRLSHPPLLFIPSLPPSSLPPSSISSSFPIIILCKQFVRRCRILRRLSELIFKSWRLCRGVSEDGGSPRSATLRVAIITLPKGSRVQSHRPCVCVRLHTWLYERVCVWMGVCDYVSVSV